MAWMSHRRAGLRDPTQSEGSGRGGGRRGQECRAPNRIPYTRGQPARRWSEATVKAIAEGRRQERRLSTRKDSDDCGIVGRRERLRRGGSVLPLEARANDRRIDRTRSRADGVVGG